MSERTQAIRGMNDVLPEETYLWRHMEQAFAECLNQYGYREIRTPILESTQLFKRTIGEMTDIVEKEMYTFSDLNGDSLTLRPEGTAGCVRACLEHGLLHRQVQKIWYSGPMFRHEKPQKGRYRQFNQFGVEALGIAGVSVELELIAICRRLWDMWDISDALHLQVNTLGELNERHAYREILIDYLKSHFEKLDEDSKRRLHQNPLRILDSKNPKMQTLISEAPKLLDVVSEESRRYFFSFCSGLKALGIDYIFNPVLVRGLDYYGHTVFEWVTDRLGSQATVCGGGRFDKLVEHLGGKPTPAVGFSIGMERLLLLRETLELNPDSRPSPLLFFIAVGEKAVQRALILSESLRNIQPHWPIVVHMAGGSFKSQFKKADKSGARLALILGDDELNQRMISVKDLRKNTEQMLISQEGLNQFLTHYLQ